MHSRLIWSNQWIVERVEDHLRMKPNKLLLLPLSSVQNHSVKKVMWNNEYFYWETILRNKSLPAELQVLISRGKETNKDFTCIVTTSGTGTAQAELELVRDQRIGGVREMFEAYYSQDKE